MHLQPLALPPSIASNARDFADLLIKEVKFNSDYLKYMVKMTALTLRRFSYKAVLLLFCYILANLPLAFLLLPIEVQQFLRILFA